MDLWIRSQSRQTLIKAVKIFTENEEVYATTNSEFDERIGVYSTKERALEVLDEIQRILQPKIIINNTSDDSLSIIDGEWVKSIKKEMKDDIKELSTVVYEMPKE